MYGCVVKYIRHPLCALLISKLISCENGELVYPPPSSSSSSSSNSSSSSSAVCSGPATQFSLVDEPYNNYFYSDCHMTFQVVVSSPGPNDNLTLIAPRLLVRELIMVFYSANTCRLLPQEVTVEWLPFLLLKMVLMAHWNLAFKIQRVKLLLRSISQTVQAMPPSVYLG